MIRRIKPFRGLGILLWGSIFFVAAGFLVACYVWVTTPSAKSLKSCIKTSLFKVDLCPTHPRYVPLRKISKYVQDAVVTAEDARFYQHQGFDWLEIRSSIGQNVRHRGYRRGASTLTQQLAKNVFLTRKKTLLRKLREAKLTFELERFFTKREILEKYLNVVEFGPGLYGIGPAARYYFDKPASNLTLGESAFLAMLLPNPKSNSVSYSRRALTPFAKRRMRTILRNMRLSGLITLALEQETVISFSAFPWDQPPVPPIDVHQVQEFRPDISDDGDLEEVEEGDPQEERPLSPSEP